MRGTSDFGLKYHEFLKVLVKLVRESIKNSSCWLIQIGLETRKMFLTNTVPRGVQSFVLKPF